MQTTCILPVFNEETRIIPTLKYYAQYVKTIHIVDNFSTDQTLKIASTFSSVRIHKKKNKGTWESQEWFDWLFEAIPSEYYLLLSCSEKLSNDFILSINKFISDEFDLVYVHRKSFTDGRESNIYGNIFVLSGICDFYHPVCRLFSRRILQTGPIVIHDNFMSLMHNGKTLELKNDNMSMHHYRKITPIRKVVDYALLEANHLFYSFNLLALLKNIVRNILTITILCLCRKLTKVRAYEIMILMLMYFLIYLECWYYRLTSKSFLSKQS